MSAETQLKMSEKKTKRGIFEDFLNNIVIFENKKVFSFRLSSILCFYNVRKLICKFFVCVSLLDPFL